LELDDVNEEGGTIEDKWRRKAAHTKSDSAAEQKVLETKESLHASRGVVCDSIFAMHPSAKSSNSIDIFQGSSFPFQ